MSWKALAWASDQKCEKAADKLILLALAERHNTESKLAYPSTAWLIEFSSLDRKTVLKSLERLQAAGLISDSGVRMGSTGGVKAWRLGYDAEAVPKTGQLERSQNSHEAVPFFPEAVPKTGRLSGPKNGTWNRDIGTGMNRDGTGDADAPTRERARRRSSLPDNFTPEPTGNALAIVAKWPPGKLAQVTDQFRNHHTAKGSLMSDWQAAFRTWVTNEEKWNGRSRDNGQRSNRPSRDGLFDAAFEAIAERAERSGPKR